jgi:hypothetical protein
MAYCDESGDTGRAKGASLTYTLGCVLVDVDHWPSAFNGMLELRRRLRDTYRLPVRAEVKATTLVGGGGPLRPLNLSPAQRSLIYRAHLREMHTLRMRAFAVVIDKRSPDLDGKDLGVLAWTTLLERLERVSYYEDTAFSITHDEGEDLIIRKVARKARRRITAGSAYGPGQVTLHADRLIDDPVPRRSDTSYFIQLADLVAYAGFRTLIVPGKSVAAVVPQFMWRELGDAVHKPVNSLRRAQEPGVVVRGK